MIADPEYLGTGDEQFAGGDAENELDAGALGEGEDAAASTDAYLVPDPAAWLETEEGKQRLGNERLAYGRDFARTFGQAVSGDVEAQRRLQANRDGKRIWENHLMAVDAKAKDYAMAETAWQELAGKSAYERAAELEANPALGRWFYDYAAYRQANGAPARQANTRQAADETRLEETYAELMADEDAAVLTDTDKAALHPINYEHLDERKAIAALAKAFAKRVSVRSAASADISAPASQARKPQTGEAARAAAGKGPPIVSGGSVPTSLTFEQAAAAYEENPTEANKQAYLRVRPKHWG